MDKKFFKQLKSEAEIYEQLKNELHFQGEELLKEILPLIKDYFVGEFDFNGRAIVCKFENGQTFLIDIKETT